MIHKSRKWRIFFISIVIVFLAGFIWIKMPPGYTFYTTYCKDYYSVISNTWEYYKYDRIIEVNGEPDRITREKVADHDIVQLEYDGTDGTRMFAFIEYENGHRSLCRMELTDPEYRFGRKKIGIGTDKSTIEKVYRNSYQGLEEWPYGGYYDVEDGNYSVRFQFDENDKVCKMVVGDAEIYHGTHGWKKVKVDTEHETEEKVVLLIDGGQQIECREIVVEDCRDECIDYCKDKRTLLFVNRKNQIVERDIAGKKQVIDMEAVDLAETVSNVQYAPFDEGLYFIYEGEIYQYSFKDKSVAKKADGIDSTWRRTYIWENDAYGYKLADNGKFSELYRMDIQENLEQKVCEGWIQSIGQAQGNSIYALQVYANATHDSSTTDLRNRIIAIDKTSGTIKIIQELGNWMEGNYLFACNADNFFYMQKKGKKDCLYRLNVSTGSKEKVFCTRNQVIGLAVN